MSNTNETTLQGSQMTERHQLGNITRAARVWPPRLLVPIAPHDARGTIKPEGRGKSPADFAFGQWMNLPDWQNGCDKQTLLIANAMRANAGLRTGYDDGTGLCHIAIDVDLNKSPAELDRTLLVRSRIVETLEGIFGPIWLRHSIGARCATFILLPIAETFASMPKIELSHPDFEVGAIEVRGRNLQQIVVGIHRDTHLPMTWTRGDRPDEHHLAPTEAAVVAFPTLTNSATLRAVLDQVLEDLAAVNVTQKAKPQQGRTNAAPTGPRNLSDQVAPSVAAIQQLLSLIVHDHTVMRYDYIEVMIAGVGMLKAMDLDADEYAEGEDAFINWAASWTGGDGTSESVERAKWDSDFSQRGDFSGWGTLCRIARKLGVSGADIAAIEAAEAFTFLPAEFA